MAEISSAPVKRLLVEATGGMRVGASALAMAADATDGFVKRLAQAAAEHARADRRKTIQDADIARAVAQLGFGGAPEGGDPAS